MLLRPSGRSRLAFNCRKASRPAPTCSAVGGSPASTVGRPLVINTMRITRNSVIPPAATSKTRPDRRLAKRPFFLCIKLQGAFCKTRPVGERGQSGLYPGIPKFSIEPTGHSTTGLTVQGRAKVCCPGSGAFGPGRVTCDGPAYHRRSGSIGAGPCSPFSRVRKGEARRESVSTVTIEEARSGS